MSEINRVNVGARLREERKRLGKSQGDFASDVGVSPRTQLAWERGEQSPNADALNLAVEVGVDVFYVLTGERREPRDDLKETLERMSLYLDAVPEAQRAAIAAVVSGFARTPTDAALLGALYTLLENRPLRPRVKKPDGKVRGSDGRGHGTARAHEKNT